MLDCLVAMLVDPKLDEVSNCSKLLDDPTYCSIANARLFSHHDRTIQQDNIFEIGENNCWMIQHCARSLGHHVEQV